MKHFFILIAAFFISDLLTCCKSNRSLNPGKAIITGDISNLDKHGNKRWIDLIYPDIFSQEGSVEHVELDSLGHFRFEMEIISPSLCWGIYNKWFPFVISPGDSLHFSIDASIWDDTNSGNLEKGKYVSISGFENKDYQSIIAFENWATDSVYTRERRHQINKAIAEKTPKEFQVYVQNWEKEVLECIKLFGAKEKAGDLFYRILQEEIKYRTLEDLLQYWGENPYQNGKELKDSELPKAYFSFLENHKMDNQDFFVEGKIGFIRMMQFYLQFQNLPERETFLDIYKNKESAKINADYFKNQASYIHSQTYGITHDLALHFFAFYNQKKVPSQSKEIYLSVSDLIVDAFVKEQFEKQFNAKIKPQFDKLSQEDYTAMDSVIGKYPGKVIYVDFWAPWCGPCMGEMPYSRQLKDSFKDKDVVFIYLACNCTEQSWKATIANKDIEGVNLLLSNDDYNILKQRFKISGIPHYLLIDKKGMVVNNNAPRPSDKSIKTNILEILQTRYP